MSPFGFAKTILVCALCLSAASSLASSKAAPLPGRHLTLNSPLLLNLDGWMAWQAAESGRRLLANISPAGTARGAVIASPERTAAFANASYRVALAKFDPGHALEAETWFKKGDAFMSRVQTHANPDGSLSEQIDRASGYMTGARDLTWSHVEVIQAIRARAPAAAALHAAE